MKHADEAVGSAKETASSAEGVTSDYRELIGLTGDTIVMQRVLGQNINSGRGCIFYRFVARGK